MVYSIISFKFSFVNRNPCLTLAFKRQFAALREILIRKSQRTHLGRVYQYPIASLPRVISAATNTSRAYIDVCNRVEINGVKYTKGEFLIIRRDVENCLSFGQIELIIIQHSKPFFLLSIHSTKEFCSHVYSFKTERIVPSEFIVMSIDEALDVFPLRCVTYDGDCYIRTKYFVC